MKNDRLMAESPGEPFSFRRPLPRLRQDLAWSRREVRGEEVWFLKDPERRTYFRFSAAVAFILRNLDGATPADALLERFEDEFAEELSAEELESVLQQAEEAGLLALDRAGEEGAVQSDGVQGSNGVRHPGTAPHSGTGRYSGTPRQSGAPPATPSQPPLLERLLHWKIAAFDPDRLLAALETRLAFLFSPAAHALWGALLFLGVAVFAANLRSIDAEFAGLLRWEVLLWLLPALLFVVILHEFGHGLACKHFGGEVREMGFLLIYFQPAFYCDISDAWMLGRRGRLWSIAGGMWVQMALWSLAVLSWRLTAPESFLHAASLLVAAVAGTGALFNLVPFLKLDGYYFLSDWVEIPNLRARSFAHLRRVFHRLLGAGEEAGEGAGEAAGGGTGGGAGEGAGENADEGAGAGAAGGGAAAQPLPARDSREARIFWLYGLGAAATSAGLLLYLLLIAHGFTARHLGIGCVALLWLGVATLAARPLGSVASPVGHAWVAVIRRPRLSRPAVALVATVILAVALFVVPWELRVSAEVRFEPMQRAVVRSEIGGIVESVAVAENQEVRKGDVLFQFSAREFRAGLEQAEAELQKARAELALLRRGARDEEIRSVESRLEKAVTREEYARRDHLKAQELYERKIIPLRELQSAEEELAVRQKEVKEARGQLDLLRAGSRPEQIERTQAEVARLESVARLAGEHLELARVRSPIDGRVVTPRLDLKVGQKVEPGAALCEIADSRRLRAEVEVPESEAAEVGVGQKVKIKARGFPDRSFWGQVVSVAPAAEADEGARQASFLPAPQSRIRVHTEVENDEGLLKPEMTGNAKIYCGKRPLIELLTRRLVRYVRTEFWF